MTGSYKNAILFKSKTHKILPITVMRTSRTPNIIATKYNGGLYLLENVITVNRMLYMNSKTSPINTSVPDEN